MERGTSPSTGWFSWSFNDSNLFSRIFIDSNYSPGSSTPPRYSPRASTPQSYSLGTSRNAECSNCKHLLDKITVLKATKFSSKLSLWKARLLSVGGRLSLIKLVLGNLPTYYMSIGMMSVAVRKNLESLPNTANRVPLFNLCGVLRRYLRGGVESSPFDSLQAAIGNVALSDQCDSCQWSLDVFVRYSVVSVCALVDAHTLDVDTVATRWNRCVPIKVNVFIWRLNLHKLSSIVNLYKKGIDVGSILCPICHDDVEMVNHTFFNCEIAKDLWALLVNWWELDIPMCVNILGWYVWLDSLHVSIRARLFLEGVGGTLLWSIRSFHNHLIFSSLPPKKAMLWDSIVLQSFLLILSRNLKLKFSWIGWLKNPLATITSL
nr:hypothetical protein [Tanacetum cinerariifolium]